MAKKPKRNKLGQFVKARKPKTVRKVSRKPKTVRKVSRKPKTVRKVSRKPKTVRKVSRKPKTVRKVSRKPKSIPKRKRKRVFPIVDSRFYRTTGLQGNFYAISSRDEGQAVLAQEGKRGDLISIHYYVGGDWASTPIFEYTETNALFDRFYNTIAKVTNRYGDEAPTDVRIQIRSEVTPE